MPNFYRQGPLHGAQGPDYAQAPRHDGPAHAHPAPTGGSSVVGRLVRRLQNLASSHAERWINFHMDMQEHLGAPRQSGASGPWPHTGVGPAPGHAPFVEHNNQHMMEMFHSIVDQLASSQAELNDRLQEIATRLDRAGGAPPAASATGAAPRRPPSRASTSSSGDIERWRQQTAASVDGHDSDVEDDRATVHTSGTSGHRPMPTYRPETRRRAPPPPPPAAADDARAGPSTREQANVVSDNEQVRIQLASDGRRGAIQTTR